MQRWLFGKTIMGYTWNWGVLFEKTGIGNEIYLNWILTGIAWLFAIGIIAWTIAMVLGTVLGIMRTLPNKTANRMASAYVTLFRNVPLLVQLFIWLGLTQRRPKASVTARANNH